MSDATSRREHLLATAGRIRMLARLLELLGLAAAVIGLAGLVVPIGAMAGMDANFGTTLAIVLIPSGIGTSFMGVMLHGAAEWAAVTADLAAHLEKLQR